MVPFTMPCTRLDPVGARALAQRAQHRDACRRRSPRRRSSTPASRRGAEDLRAVRGEQRLVRGDDVLARARSRRASASRATRVPPISSTTRSIAGSSTSSPRRRRQPVPRRPARRGRARGRCRRCARARSGKPSRCVTIDRGVAGNARHATGPDRAEADQPDAASRRALTPIAEQLFGCERTAWRMRCVFSTSAKRTKPFAVSVRSRRPGATATLRLREQALRELERAEAARSAPGPAPRRTWSRAASRSSRRRLRRARRSARSRRCR